ncbi:uncharacterized protein ACNLHF_021651 isoform 1-T1 [Anomaloglossus baeobatrachus]
MRAEGTAFVYSVERCTCLTIRSACSSGIHGPQRAPAAGHAYGPFKELCFSHPHKLSAIVIYMLQFYSHGWWTVSTTPLIRSFLGRKRMYSTAWHPPQKLTVYELQELQGHVKNDYRQLMWMLSGQEC